MSLEHAILGFLQYRPLSGYDLKKVFDNSVRHFWPADQGHIYRTLARLAERGWAVQEVIEQQDRPDRKVYHITEGGRAELHRWLTTPLPPHETRSPELIQVFFAGRLSQQEALAIFEREAEELRQTLAVYRQIPQDPAAYPDIRASTRDFAFWLLTLEAGIKSAEAYLAWIENVITRLTTGDFPPPVDRSNHG